MSMSGMMFRMFTGKELSTDTMHLITRPFRNLTEQQKRREFNISWYLDWHYFL